MGSVAGRLVGVLATAVTLVGCSAGSPDAGGLSIAWRTGAIEQR